MMVTQPFEIVSLHGNGCHNARPSNVPITRYNHQSQFNADTSPKAASSVAIIREQVSKCNLKNKFLRPAGVPATLYRHRKRSTLLSKSKPRSLPAFLLAGELKADGWMACVRGIQY